MALEEAGKWRSGAATLFLIGRRRRGRWGGGDGGGVGACWRRPAVTMEETADGDRGVACGAFLDQENGVDRDQLG